MPVKGQAPLLKMSKPLLNGGWKRFWLSPGLENPIEKLIGNTALGQEKPLLIVQCCPGEAAKERTVGNQVGIESKQTGRRSTILQRSTHRHGNSSSWRTRISCM